MNSKLYKNDNIIISKLGVAENNSLQIERSGKKKTPIYKIERFL